MRRGPKSATLVHSILGKTVIRVALRSASCYVITDRRPITDNEKASRASQPTIRGRSKLYRHGYHAEERKQSVSSEEICRKRNHIRE
jgi:hypothetical protein